MWSRLALIAVVLAVLAPDASAAGTCDRPLPAGDRTVDVSSGGRERPFLLYVPRTYDGHTPLPLALNLHGTLSDGPGQMDISGLRADADRDGFLVAAPTGGARSTTGASWVVPGTPPRGEAPEGGYPDDLRYLSDVITRVQEISCQDPARVIATGYSGGGRMSSALACGLAARVAAVVVESGLRAGAPRAGAGGQPEPDPGTCAPARPLPVIAVHGTSDSINPYDGGGQDDWQYPVPAAFARWEQLLRCTAPMATTRFSPSIDLLAGVGCRAPLRLYRVNGGGHQWFGGDPTKNPLYLALGHDPKELRTSDLVAEAVRGFRLQAPRPRLRLSCRPGRRVHVRASATTDAPLAMLTVRVNGRRLAGTSATARLGRSGRVRATARVTDSAGLSGSAVRTTRCR